MNCGDVCPGSKTQREALALLVATMLEARTANLMTLAAFLPRNTAWADMRHQWIARFIDNHRIDCAAVMELFARGAGQGCRAQPRRANHRPDQGE